MIALRGRLMVALTLTTLFVACDATEDAPPVETRTESLVEVSRESSDKKAFADHGVIRDEVAWDDAKRLPKLDLDRLPLSEREKVAEVDLPMLLPDRPMVSKAFIMTGATWYTAKMPADGHSVYIMGSRGSVPGDLGLTDAQKRSIENFTVYRTHEIVTLTFRAHGVAYSIDVECERPTDDVRCNEDAYVLELAESLVLAGGAK